MPDPVAPPTEEDLAKDQKKNLEDSLVKNRTLYISLAVLFILCAGVIAVSGLWMIALIALLLGLIFLSQYFDANGNLHEVRRRSTRTLVRDFSVLRRPPITTPANSESAPHEAGPR